MWEVITITFAIILAILKIYLSAIDCRFGDVKRVAESVRHDLRIVGMFVRTKRGDSIPPECNLIRQSCESNNTFVQPFLHTYRCELLSLGVT